MTKPALEAYLVQISLTNVKCFRGEHGASLHTSDGLPARWTVLLGDNGSGKSTLLECVAMGIPQRPEIEGVGHVRLPAPIMGSGVELLSQGESESSVELTFELREGRNGRVENTCTNRFTQAQDGRGTSRSEVTTLDVPVLGYGTSREIGATAFSRGVTDPVSSLFLGPAQLVHPYEWLLGLYYSSLRPDSDGTAQVHIGRVLSALTLVLPDVSGIEFHAPSTESEPTPSDIAGLLSFSTPYATVPLHKLSVGYRAVITWIVDLASRLYQRRPKSNNPMLEHALVLVDELDLHLHPRWQRTLQSALVELFPGAQFIVTSHSPLVVQASTDSAVVLCRQQRDRCVLSVAEPHVARWRVDQLLSSDLFGAVGVFNPEIERMFERRRELIMASEGRPTKEQQEELDQINASLRDVPTTDSVSDWEAMRLIQRAAELLRERDTTDD